MINNTYVDLALQDKGYLLDVKELIHQEVVNQAWIHYQDCNGKVTELKDFQLLEVQAHKLLIFELYREANLQFQTSFNEGVNVPHPLHNFVDTY